MEVGEAVKSGTHPPPTTPRVTGLEDKGWVIPDNGDRWCEATQTAHDVPCSFILQFTQPLSPLSDLCWQLHSASLVNGPIAILLQQRSFLQLQSPLGRPPFLWNTIAASFLNCGVPAFVPFLRFVRVYTINRKQCNRYMRKNNLMKLSQMIMLVIGN